MVRKRTALQVQELFCDVTAKGHLPVLKVHRPESFLAVELEHAVRVGLDVCKRYHVRDRWVVIGHERAYERAVDVERVPPGRDERWHVVGDKRAPLENCAFALQWVTHPAKPPGRMNSDSR